MEDSVQDEIKSLEDEQDKSSKAASTSTNTNYILLGMLIVIILILVLIMGKIKKVPAEEPKMDEPMVKCSSCGSKIPESSEFCPDCGAIFDEEEEEEEKPKGKKKK